MRISKPLRVRAWRAIQVPRCGVPMVTTPMKPRALGRRARARRGSPVRPCCGRRGPAPCPWRPRAGRPPLRSCRDSGRSSRTPARGSRPRTECPSPRSWRIQGFHRPRLQKKPWTRTTPRRPCASAGTAVGNRGRAKRLAPEEDPGRDQDLDPPCREQLAERGAVGRLLGIRGAKPAELETEGRHVSAGDEQRRHQRPGRLADPERNRRADEGRHDDQGNDQLLDAGQHGMIVDELLARRSIGSAKEKGLRHYDGGLFKLIA